MFQNKNRTEILNSAGSSDGKKPKTPVKPLNHRRRESLDFMVEHGISFEDGRLNWFVLIEFERGW